MSHHSEQKLHILRDNDLQTATQKLRILELSSWKPSTSCAVQMFNSLFKFVSLTFVMALRFIV